MICQGLQTNEKGKYTQDPPSAQSNPHYHKSSLQRSMDEFEPIVVFQSHNAIHGAHSTLNKMFWT